MSASSRPKRSGTKRRKRSSSRQTAKCFRNPPLRWICRAANKFCKKLLLANAWARMLADILGRGQSSVDLFSLPARSATFLGVLADFTYEERRDRKLMRRTQYPLHPVTFGRAPQGQRFVIDSRTSSCRSISRLDFRQRRPFRTRRRVPSNEKEISHGRASSQTH